MLVSFLVFIVLICWFIGNRFLKKYYHKHKTIDTHHNIQNFIQKLPLVEDKESSIQSSFNGNNVLIPRLSVLTIFIKDRKRKIPPSFDHYIQRFCHIPENVIFLYVKFLDTAYYVGERCNATNHGNGIFEVVIKLGFAEYNFQLLKILQESPSFQQEISRKIEHSTIVVEEERIIVVNNSWIWRWPLYFFALLKSTFPKNTAFLERNPENTVSIGIAYKLE